MESETKDSRKIIRKRKIKEIKKRYNAKKKEVKRNIRKKINSIKGKPKLKKTLHMAMNGVDYVDKHKMLKGAIAALLALTAVHIAGDKINPKYQVAYINNGTAVVDKDDHGLVRASGEDRTRRSIFDNVTVTAESGDKDSLPYNDITVISNAFSKFELANYDVVYRLKDDQPLLNKTEKGKIITNLPIRATVIGKRAAKDGYIKIHTDNGLTGYVPESSVKKIMDIPEQQSMSTSTSTSTSTSYKYKAFDGKVLGLDVNPSGVNFNQLEEMLAGTRKKDSFGSFKDTEVNYVYIKMGGYNHRYSDHRVLWAEGEELDFYMGKVFRIIDLCKKYNKAYGMYFYSTAITEKEGKEEAVTLNKMIQYLKDHGVEAPALPLAIDAEQDDRGYDRQNQVLYNSEKIAEASKARAIIYNSVRKENGDYIKNVAIYTDQNTTGVVGNSKRKVFDLEEFAKNIETKEIPIWWVSAAESAAKSGQRVSAMELPDGKKYKVFCEQIITDTKVNESFLVDYDKIDEKYYKDFIDKDRQNKAFTGVIAPQVSSTKSPLNTTMIGYMPRHRTTLYGIGSGKSLGYIDEGTQLIGKVVPDKKGFVHVVTRDGRNGKVRLSNLTAINNRQPELNSEEDREEI